MTSGPAYDAYKRNQLAHYEAQMSKKMSDDDRAKLIEEITARTGQDCSTWTRWRLANKAVSLGIRLGSLLNL